MPRWLDTLLFAALGVILAAVAVYTMVKFDVVKLRASAPPAASSSRPEEQGKCPCTPCPARAMSACRHCACRSALRAHRMSNASSCSCAPRSARTRGAKRLVRRSTRAARRRCRSWWVNTGASRGVVWTRAGSRTMRSRGVLTRCCLFAVASAGSTSACSERGRLGFGFSRTRRSTSIVVRAMALHNS